MAQEALVQLVLGIALVPFIVTSYYAYRTFRKAKRSLHATKKRLERVGEGVRREKLALQKIGMELGNKMDVDKANRLMDGAVAALNARKVKAWQSRKKLVLRQSF